MKNKTNKTSNIIVKVITLICVLITVISGVINYLLPLIINKHKINMKNSSAVGIIGGADGPTSIFISTIPSSRNITLIFGILSLIGTGYLLIKRKS